MYINADKFTPADSLYIPTGEIKDVQGTPMDFRTPTEIGKKVRLQLRPDQRTLQVTTITGV